MADVDETAAKIIQELIDDPTLYEPATVSVIVHQRGHSFLRNAKWDDPTPVTDVMVMQVHDFYLEHWPKEPNMWLHRETSYDCGYCGQLTELVADGMNVYSTTACSYPEGFTSMMTFTCSSGKLVINDSLRDVYNPADDDFASYNTWYGQFQVILANAVIGCAYGPVGNSCPGLYEDLSRPGHYVMANPTSSEDPSRENDAMPFPSKHLAGVCTNLWAYSIADYDDYIAKGGSIDRTDQVIDFPAGTYHVYHHTGEKNFDGDADWREDEPHEVIYADIVKVADVHSDPFVV